MFGNIRISHLFDKYSPASRDVITQLSRTLFVIHRLGLAVINYLHTKFKISMFARYEDMNDNAKCII